jgi:arginase
MRSASGIFPARARFARIATPPESRSASPMMRSSIPLPSQRLMQWSNFATWRSTSPTLSKAGKAGLGMGDVVDRMLPATKLNPQDPPLFRHLVAPHTVSIIGAPLTFGQPFVGVDNTPALLRDAGLRGHLTSLGWRVHDGPDLELQSAKALLGGEMHTATTSPGQQVNGMNAKNTELVGKGTHIIAERVASVCREGQFPLILGGDHSISLGSVAGVLKEGPNTGVLWIDAHADLNTPFNSDSGNMHGMPLGMLVKGIAPAIDYKSMAGCEWLAEYGAPLLDPSSLVYVGLRDVDAEERKAIRKLGILAFTMTDIDHYGIGKVMDMALEHLMATDPDRPLHLSFDIDAVDPEHAPATGTAVRGGLTYREAHYVCESVAASGALASADIVELNPTLSDDSGAEETIQLGLHLVASFMGKSII